MISCEITPEMMDQLADKQWVVANQLWTEDELIQLKHLALKRWDSGQFQPAKVGRSSEQQRAAQIRSDWTCWVDLKLPEFENLAEKVESLRQNLNQSLYLGINQFECHFARYAEGQFYEEHIDQPRLQSPLHGERVISFVLYLNENWQPGNGGELRLRLNDKEILIEPLWGRLALFRSDTVPHAVLASRTERWSLTGWFRRS